jgi:hypothetical protein
LVEFSGRPRMIFWQPQLVVERDLEHQRKQPNNKPHSLASVQDSKTESNSGARPGIPFANP